MTSAGIAALFQRQAAARPRAPAIVATDSSLSYGELDRLAARVARDLRIRAGTSPTRIAVLARHAPVGLVAMVGTLMSGHALVPVSPHDGDDYLRSVFDDAAVVAIVADAVLAERAAGLAGERPLLVVSEDPGEVADVDLAADTAPEALAAIIYTSGTTGRPKGVMTTHAAIAERARQYREVSGIGPQDRQASIIPWQFSAAFPDLYGALLAGAGLHLYDAHRHGVEELGRWIRAHEITLLDLPVALLRRLLDRRKQEPFPTVRLVSASGDRLDADDLRRLMRLLPTHAKVVHGYGCTEANLVAQAVFDRAAVAALEPRATTLPVGCPVSGKTVLILDDEGLPLAGGREGELGLLGPQLSPGYWNQPDATARAFVRTATGRVYRSGDLGRLRDDGTLLLLGRAGTRVKLRGQRVDLAAAESLLRGLPSVRNAAIEAQPGPAAQTRLVAYVEPLPGERVTGPAIQRGLRARAPAHWVPARVVILAALPLTASGKIDHAALPPPAGTRPLLETPYRHPESEVEARLARLWAEQLELDDIGVDDRFFELGGDSLALAGLASRIEAELGRRLELEALPADLTIATMAALLEPGSAARPTVRRLAPIIEKRRSRRQAWRRRLVKLGPPGKRHVIPYGIGIRLQRLWVTRTRTRRRLFSEPTEIVRQWHTRLELVEPFEQVMLTSLMANTWLKWRERALADPRAFADWVTVEGERHLPAGGNDRGIVFVVVHTRFRHVELLRPVAARCGRELTGIQRARHRAAAEQLDRDHPALRLDRTIQFQRASSLLRRGGACTIAGDGTHGAATVEVPFLGQPRHFRLGAAELAVSSGAAFVPVFTTMASSGRVRVTFEPPLVSNASSPRTRAVELTRLFAERFERAWPRLLSSLSWRVLRQALDPPPGS